MIEVIRKLAGGIDKNPVRYQWAVQVVWSIPFLFSEYRPRIPECGGEREQATTRKLVEIMRAVELVVGKHSWAKPFESDYEE